MGQRNAVAFFGVARAEARKRENSFQNPPIRALVFVAEIGVYVGVYEVTSGQENKSKDLR